MKTDTLQKRLETRAQIIQAQRKRERILLASTACSGVEDEVAQRMHAAKEVIRNTLRKMPDIEQPNSLVRKFLELKPSTFVELSHTPEMRPMFNIMNTPHTQLAKQIRIMARAIKRDEIRAAIKSQEERILDLSRQQKELEVEKNEAAERVARLQKSLTKFEK